MAQMKTTRKQRPDVMTVAELIIELQKMPPTAKVCCAASVSSDKTDGVYASVLKEEPLRKYREGWGNTVVIVANGCV